MRYAADPRAHRSDPPSLLRHQGQRIRAVGEIAGWWRLPWISALWPFVRRYRILVWHAAEGSLPEASFPPAARRQQISSQHVDQLTRFNPQWTRRTIEQRLRTDCRGDLWTLRGEIVHARWQSAAPARLSYLGIHFEPRPGDLLSVDSFTRSSHRQQGLYAAGLAWMLAEARRSGRDRCVLLTAWWNRPILRLLTRIGARPVGRLDVFRLGQLSRYRASGTVRLRDRSAFSVNADAAARRKPVRPHRPAR